jgi:hypothetical protein
MVNQSKDSSKASENSIWSVVAEREMFVGVSLREMFVGVSLIIKSVLHDRQRPHVAISP